MRTDDLIADLAGRAAPVRPLPSPGMRALGWLPIALASAALGMVVFGVRPHVDSLLGESEFVVGGILAFGTALFGILAALTLAIPGAERTPALRVVTLTALGLWIALLARSIALAGIGFSGVSHWYICFVRVMAIALVPAVAVVVMLHRALPLRRGWTFALAIAGATAIGALAIQFICPLPDAGHALVGHLGAVLVAGLAGAAMGLRDRR